tara:strand:- start:176 stop:490 length:315 start_codon:yes stop_codon:yes gene_type:complete
MENDRSYKRTAIYLMEYILNDMIGDEPVKVKIQLGNTGRKLFSKRIMVQTKLSDYFNVVSEIAEVEHEKYIYYTFNKHHLLKDISGLIKAIKLDLENEMFKLRK